MKTEPKIYQVVFSDCRPWEKASWNIAWTEWHLPDCPLIGIRDIQTARLRAKKLKTKYGRKVQAIIISGMDVAKRNADYLFGIKALRGADAREDAASYVLEREEIEEELSRLVKRQ